MMFKNMSICSAGPALAIMTCVMYFVLLIANALTEMHSVVLMNTAGISHYVHFHV